MRHAMTAVMVPCFFVTCVAAQPRGLGESKSWKVTVVSAEYGLPGEEIPWEPGKYFVGLGENQCFLFLKLHFEYKGPDGAVPGPRVTLVNEKDEKFSNWGNLRSQGILKEALSEWIFSATYSDPKELKTRSLKTGEAFGDPWLEFLIVIPRGSKNLRIVFGGEEIPGIVVNPTKVK